jgi:hypothetical protein
MEVARGASDLSLAPLSQLAPMLERFHDGEATEAELDEVMGLMERREDVAAYLEALDSLSDQVKDASSVVSEAFDGGSFWDKIEVRLDEQASGQVAEVVPLRRPQPKTAERPAFCVDNHQVMIYRYYDGEVGEAERAQVNAWAEIDPKVSKTLAAMSELTLATRVAVERAQQRADMSKLWGRVQAELEREMVEREAGVVSLARVREQRVGLWAAHQREIVTAVIAALVTIVGIGVFGDKLFRGERVVVERTVVIVDSAESAPGSSVMVRGGVRIAPGEQPTISAEPSSDEEPTVIWLIDEASEGADKGARKNPI